jgi:hypothetical protein
MGIVLELGLVVVLVILAASFVTRITRGRVSDEREAITVRRVEAYMTTIRREGQNPELAAMSDPELRDLLLSSARNLRIENDRRWMVLTGAGVVALLAAIMVGTQEGLRGFGVALVIAAIVVYALNEIAVRRSREPLLARGIDVERLRVE